MNTIEYRFEIAFEVLPRVGMAGRQGGCVGNRCRIRELRAIGCYVVVGDDREYSAIGVTEKIQVVGRNAEDAGSLARLFHSPHGQIAQLPGPDKQALLNHEQVELRAVTAREPHDADAAAGLENALNCTGAAQEL